jgi:3-methylfumaryl-CoA hydratase
MFAGRRTTFHAELRIGDEVRKDSTITGITTKEGRQGLMVFVTVRAEISCPRGLAITEEQDIVYRGEPDPKVPPAPPQPAPGNALWSKSVTPDEVMLFRYSALTFNGHRIHYDHRYVTGVEATELVMNGGLTTLLLHELSSPRQGVRCPDEFPQRAPAVREPAHRPVRRTGRRRRHGEALGHGPCRSARALRRSAHRIALAAAMTK